MGKLEKEIEKAAKLSTDLLSKLSRKADWDKEDEQVMKRLTKLVGLVAKLSALNAMPEEKDNSDKDEQIIERFLNRKKE